MKRYISMAAFMLLAFAASAQTVDRTKAPGPGPAPAINIGKYETFTLKNGLKVFVVENHKLPTLSIQLTLDLGPMQEGDAAGYVEMAGQMLRKGSKGYSKDKISSEIDFIGAEFSTSSNGFYAYTLKKHTDRLLAIVSDVLMNPTFPAEELDALKLEAKSNLAAGKSSPDEIAGNVGMVLRYGKNHPYGELMTEQTLEKINIEKIKSYYQTYFKPSAGYLIIVGDTDVKEAKKLAEKYFGKWLPGTVTKGNFPMPTAPSKTEVAVVDKAGAVQSVINIHYAVEFKPGNPDAIKASVMNSLLGGGVFSGRLMQNIREDKGYTYGAGSSLTSDPYVGNFEASATVRNNVTDSSVVEFLYEMNRLRDEPVTEDELSLVKNSMTGSFARSLESPQTVARFALNTALYKLPADYYQTYLQKLNAVTIADVQAMAKKYVLPANAYIQIVGNVAELGNKMERFGKVTEYDIYGNPVKKVTMTGAMPTADQVVEMYLKARGGREKVAAMKEIYTSMAAPIPGMGNIEFVVAEAVGKKAVIQKIAGQSSKQLFLDGKVIMSSPMGKQELDAEQSKQFAGQHILSPELDYAGNGFTVAFIGAKVLDGKEVYQVQVTSPAGSKSVNSYLKDSGLLWQTVSETVGTQIYEDYKDVDGVLFPYTIKTVLPNGMVLDGKVQTVRVNKGFEAGTFE